MAKKYKGITFELGADTSKFVKGLNDIDKTTRSTQKELKQIGNSLNFNPKSIELLKQKEQVLNETLEESKKKLQLLESAQADVEKQFKNGDMGADEYRKFQREIIETKSKIEHYTSELKQTNQETKRAEKEAKSIKTEFGHFKDKVKDTAHQIPGLNKVLDKMDHKMKDSEKETGKFKKAMSGIGSVVKGAGKAIGVSMAAVGAGVAAVSVAIGKGVQRAAEHGDQIDKMSQKLGMSREGYQKWGFVLSQAGVDINSTTTGMKTLTNQIEAAKKGSADSIGYFQKLGISMEDLNSMSREDIFGAVVSGLQGMADRTDRAALANKMFGKSGQNLTPLFNETAESTAKLKKRAEEMGMVMSNDAVDAAKNYADSLDGLKNTFNTLIDTLFSNMLPGLTTVFDGLTELLAGADGAKAKIISGAKEVIDSVSGVLPRFMDIISSVLSVILEIAPQIISSLLTSLIGILPEAISKIQEILQAILTAIIDNAPILAQTVVDLVKMLADFLVANAVQVVDAALQIIIILAQSLAPALPNILVAIVDCVLRVVDLLLDNVDLLIDCVLEIILAIATALPTLCVKIFEKIPSIIVKLVAVILKAIPKLLSAVAIIVSRIVSATVQSNGRFVSACGKIIAKMISAIKTKVKSFIDIGKNLIKGMVEGIKSMGTWVWDKIKEFCSGIVDKVKVFFGIHSPSTLFAYFGEMLARGLGLGFTKSMQSISDDMVKAVPGNFESSFRMQSGSSNYSTSGSGIEYVGINEVALKKILSDVMSEGITVQAYGKPFGRMIKNVNS